MIVRGNIGDLLNPAMRKIFFDEYKRFPEMYSQVFQVMTSERNQEKLSSFTAFGLAKEVNEGTEIPSEDPIQGYDVTFTHGKIGTAFKVTKESIEDDLFNIINKEPAKLALAVRRKIEKDAADVINDGFTAANGGDGKALFASDHPRADGGTAQSNTATAALSETSLVAGTDAMRALKDDKGQLIYVVPDTLLIPPALENSARILLQSTQRTGVANNDINPLKGKMKIVVWDWLSSAAGGSDTAWYLTDSYQKQLVFFWRRKLGMARDDNVGSEIARWYVSARYSCGYSDWHGVYGSTGAA